MPVINPPQEGSAIKYQYVNPDIPAGNAVASALIGNPKTPFASTAIIPESSASLGGIANIKASGVLSSGITALSLTLTIEMQGVIVATATQAIGVNLANTGWTFEIVATILNNGSIEVQGVCTVGSSVLPIKNNASFTMSTVGGVPVIATAQYGTLALGGSITLRQLIVQVY